MTRLNYNPYPQAETKPREQGTKTHAQNAIRKQAMLNNILVAQSPQAGAQGAVASPTSSGYGRTV